jgi:glucokinase
MAYPNLLADIGGTNARFALETAPGKLEFILVLKCADYPNLSDAMRAYLGRPESIQLGAQKVKRVGIAIANPVHGDLIQMMNHHWTFSIQAMKQEFALDTFLVANDFKALAMALPFLNDTQKVQIGGGQAEPNSVIGLIGPGTGLGVCGLIPTNGQWVALDSEGGHASFAPTNPIEIEMLQFAMKTHHHVSSERFLSGAGMLLTYQALAEHHKTTAEADITIPEIMRRGLANECPICKETLSVFCEVLGTAAGNLAIMLGTTGGMYIGGGIVPRLGQFFQESQFRYRFEHKGRLTKYLSQVPTYIITDPYPTFIGIAALLAQI